MSRILQYRRFGDPVSVIEPIEREEEGPAAGEVLIAVEATPLTFNDLYCMRGKPGFQRPLPAVPGGRGVGRVIAVGPSVAGISDGQRVFLPRAGGTWRDVMRAKADGLQVAPDGGDVLQLALVNSNVVTAFALLNFAAPLRRGDWAIQNGAGSSCGQYIVALANRMGLNLVNVVRRESSAERVRAVGGSRILVDDDSLAERVAELTRGAPIPVAFDMVGGPSTGRLAACLTDRGRIACYGNASGQPASVPVDLLLFRHLTVFGFLTEDQMQQAGVDAERLAAIYRDLSSLVVDGVLRSEVAGVYSFDEVRDAVRHQDRDRGGKIILVPHR
ncbi:MAG: zinc-dependent alcohol dehydrogenase family protein [Alphaproteobacteria bacterium]|nr:zinc-dependent alcohol dehydrogenase family protein [Alphaproteobacteria bacterium]